MYNKFWFDTNFFVRNLDVRVELRQYQSLSQRIFSFLDRMVLFLSSLSLFIYFFHFFQVLPSAFDFPRSKRSFIIIELPRVNFVKWRSKQICKWHEKQAPRCAVAAKILPGDSPGYKIMTPSWCMSFIRNAFFKITRVLLKISEIFLYGSLGQMFEFS